VPTKYPITKATMIRRTAIRFNEEDSVLLERGLRGALVVVD
jgi:hypothetical protein